MHGGSYQLVIVIVLNFAQHIINAGTAMQVKCWLEVNCWTSYARPALSSLLDLMSGNMVGMGWSSGNQWMKVFVNISLIFFKLWTEIDYYPNISFSLLDIPFFIFFLDLVIELS